MLDDGERLVPGFSTRARCACGRACGRCSRTPRPADTDTRDVTRAHALLDHHERDGVSALRDDHRRQAHDLPADGRGHASTRSAGSSATARRARRATEPLPGSESGEYYQLGERLGRKRGASCATSSSSASAR